MFNSRSLLVRFFCLLVLVFSANSAIAKTITIRPKNIKTFEKVIKNLEEKNYSQAVKLLEKVESIDDLNNLEKAYAYNIRGRITLEQQDYETSLMWFKKVTSLKNDDLPVRFLSRVKTTIKLIEKIIKTHKPNYQKNIDLLASLDKTDIITEEHHKLALAAFKMSKQEEARAILGRVEELHDSKNVLPEKWLILKADLTADKAENLKLWQSIVKHYPNKDNKIGLAGSLSDNDKIKEAGSIYLELYKQGKLKKESRILIAAYFYREQLEKPLNASLVIAKGFHDKLIEKSTVLKKRLDLFFKEAKKDKTITAQEWLDAGDKFVLYGDKDKAKVCFKKAKKDKTLRDVAKQRLKELKQS